MSPLPEGATLAAPQFEPILSVFEGTLLDLSVANVPSSYDATRIQSRLKMPFTEVDVIASRAPYNFPTFEIDMLYTPDRRQTPWDALRQSMVELLPKDAPADPNWFIGHKLRMEWKAPGTLRVNVGNNRWEVDPDAKCWLATALDGVEGGGEATEAKDIYQICAEMINGKNITEFAQDFYSNQVVRSAAGYSDAVSELAGNRLGAVLVEKGLVTENADGTYTKVG